MRIIHCLLLMVLLLFIGAAGGKWVWSACCYFSAMGSDVTQPAQKAFITFDPQEDVETFTVQPKFEGNAKDFGMVIPTPARPKLTEMPREFFKELAVFTILKPMPLDKYKQFLAMPGMPGMPGMGGPMAQMRKSSVRVIEEGTVGSLEYKIIVAGKGSDLYDWLKDNKYSYSGDEKTLDFYIGKKWFFTVMRIDPKQMKRKPDGSYSGEVTPTRFQFSSAKLIYPLRITQISVPKQTEALFYVQAPDKMDLQGSASFQYSWAQMWYQACQFAVPEKLTAQEKAWMKVVQPRLNEFAQFIRSRQQEFRGWQPARLEWAKKITQHELDILNGTAKFDREAPAADVKNLKILNGHIRKGQFITKIRKVFMHDEMSDDLTFVRAKVGGLNDDMEYEYILPTSPP
jgi:hypothetical protein